MSHWEVHQATPAMAPPTTSSAPRPTVTAVPAPDFRRGGAAKLGADEPLTIHGGTPAAIDGIIAVPLGTAACW